MHHVSTARVAALCDWQPGQDIAAGILAARTPAELVACRTESDCADAAGAMPPVTFVIVPLLPRFEADEAAADPALMLAVEADVELRRNPQGTVERRRGYVFRTAWTPFTVLTRNHAAVLRTRQDQATRALAGLIVADLFGPVAAVSPPPAP